MYLYIFNVLSGLKIVLLKPNLEFLCRYFDKLKDKIWQIFDIRENFSRSAQQKVLSFKITESPKQMLSPIKESLQFFSFQKKTIRKPPN